MTKNTMKAVVVIPILCLFVSTLATAEQSPYRNDTADIYNTINDTACAYSVNQRDDAAILNTNITSRVDIEPAKPGSMYYFDHCAESRRHVFRHKRSHGAGLPHVNDCYVGIYPIMCDYNPNRIPSHIQMVDCGKCGGQDNRSRKVATCVKRVGRKNIIGQWQPINMTILLPFNQSATNVYHLINQRISIGCHCEPN